MDNSDSSNSNLLVVGTAYKELRIYDVRANSIQRRPVLFTSDKDKERIVEHRITAVCPLSKYHSVIVGDAAGFMCSVDLRNIQHGVKGRYNGPAGSIRQIVQHESLPIVACVGLDRMLRTFETRKRKMLDCVYLKQRLNCMLFCSDSTWGSSDGSSNNTSGEQVDSNAAVVDEEGSINDEDDVQDYINSDDETKSGSSDENSSSEESDSGSESDSSEVVERHVGLKHSNRDKNASRNAKKRRP